MPDAGRARYEDFIVELPATRPDYPPLPWDCAGVTMLHVYFEVHKGPLLDRLPPEFNCTSPPYCRLFVIDHPSSPIGPFREATIALGCRLNLMPAAFVAASITDNPKALAAGLFDRGYPTASGAIEFAADAEQASAAVSDGNGPLLTVVLPALQTIEPNRLAYDHVDSLRTVGEPGARRVELAVTSPDIRIERAAISKSARIEYAAGRESVWHALRCRNVISAQVVGGSRTFAAAKPPGA